MAELNEGEWEVDGLLVDGNPYLMKATTGLEDAAVIEVESQDTWGDGASAGKVRLSDRDVSLTIGLRGNTESQVDALKAAMAPKTNRLAKKLLRWRHNGVTKRMHFLPSPGQSLAIPGDFDYLDNGYADAVARLWCPDPVIYSDAVTTTTFAEATPGDATSMAITNAGSLAAVYGAPPGSDLGVYRWTITAGDDGCTWPFVRNADHTDEFWMLAEELGDGGIARIDWERLSYRNVTVRSAEVQGPGGCPIPRWPSLRPGVNNIEIGCFDGSVTATFEHRSTW